MRPVMTRRWIAILALALATPVALPAADPPKASSDKTDAKPVRKKAPVRAKGAQPVKPSAVPSVVDMSFFFPI